MAVPAPLSRLTLEVAARRVLLAEDGRSRVTSTLSKACDRRSLDGLRFGFSTGREMAAELAILCGSLNVGLSRLPKGSGANLTTRFSSGSSICLLIFAPASLFRAVPWRTLPANSL